MPTRLPCQAGESEHVREATILPWPVQRPTTPVFRSGSSARRISIDAFIASFITEIAAFCSCRVHVLKAHKSLKTNVPYEGLLFRCTCKISSSQLTKTCSLASISSLSKFRDGRNTILTTKALRRSSPRSPKPTPIALMERMATTWI